MGLRVFLSSVFQTLESVRPAVHDQLKALGYDVWWAEALPRNLSNEGIRAACLQGIESSDIYLGIFPPRYGSDPLGIGFTDLEYQHAVSKGVPRFLYVVHNPKFTADEDQRTRQRAFLQIVRDPDLSRFRTSRVRSLSELLNRIAIDFERLRQNPPKVAAASGAPVIESLRTAALSIDPFEPVADLSVAEATALLRKVPEHSFQEAARLGLIYIQRFFSHPQWFNREFLNDLDEFLLAWHYITSWVGIRGAFGPTSISKARIVLSQMRNDYEGVYRLADNVASGLYGERRLPAAKRWCQVAQRSAPLPWLQGALFLGENNFDNAGLCYREILKQPGLDHDLYGRHLASYALCLVKQGRLREGFALLEQVIKSKDLQPPTLTHAFRTLAKAHQSIGDWATARESCDIAISIARANYLRGPLRKTLAQRRQMKLS